MDIYRREAVAIEAGSGSDEAPWSHRFCSCREDSQSFLQHRRRAQATAAEYDSLIHSVFDTVLSTFLFRFFQTTCGDPHQFLLGQVSNVKPYFPELLSWRPATRAADPIVRLLEKAKNRFEGA